MNAFQPISGTFVDGVAADIPSNNWGKDEWEREFDVFKQSGIDTVIIIRVGFKDSAMYKSTVIKPLIYEDDDLVEIILRAGVRNDINVYIGMHDTEKYWVQNDWDSEVAINRELIHEIRERYSRFSSFKGWYLSHEGSMHFHQTKIWKPLVEEIKKFDQTRKVLVSPRYQGRKYTADNPVPPQVHARHFDHILTEMEGLIDAYAFMDGHVDFQELEQYVKATYEIFEKHGAVFWSNLETFDRDMPWRFPPIEWIKMKYKLEVVQPYVKKIITFEAPHFLSPNSMFPSAHKLYERYKNYLKRKCKAEEITKTKWQHKEMALVGR